MKRILLFIFLLASLTSIGQVYQQMPQAGYGPVKRMLFASDGVVSLPIGLGGLRSIAGGRDIGQIRWNTTDSSFYGWTGFSWAKSKGFDSTYVYILLNNTIANVSANTTNIATNTANIVTNTTNISTNATAITGKEPIITAGTISQYWRGDKTWQPFPASSVYVVSYGKNSTNDSTILLLSNGTRYAAIDNNSGGGGGSGIVSQTVVTANGFSGTSTGGTTPAITLSTPVVGITKGSGGAFVAAISGTDYVIPSALTPYALLSSPALINIPTAPTASLGTNTTQLATTAFVTAATAADSIKAGYLQILDSVLIGPTWVKRIGVDSVKLATTIAASGPANAVLLTTDQTVQGLKSWQGAVASDSATLSTTEMVPTGSGTNYTGSFPTGVTHTVGSTSPYTSTFTPTIGTSYVITTRNEVRTAGSATLTGGGIYSRAISGLYGDSRESFTAVTAAPITLTSTTDYDGMMTVSVKVAGVTAPISNVKSASGITVGEVRYMGQNSQAWGINAGRRMLNSATNNLLLGNNAGASLVTGLGNVLLQAGATTTSGNYNFAAVVGALAANITGVGNIVIGNNAFNNNLSGSLNLVLGHRSVQYILDGSTPATNINNGVYLGANQRASSINATGESLVGFGTYGIGNNIMVLGGATQVSTVIPYGTFSVPNLTGGSATDSVLTRDATGLFHIRSASAFGGGGGGSVTVFSKTDGFGITSTVTNATTTPNHTIATDTTVIQSKVGNVTLLALKENSLGNPATSGFVLSSTSAGVRSWIAPATGGGGGTVTNVFANPPLSITGGSTISPTVNADTLTTAGLQTKFRTDSARANIYTSIATNTTNISANTTAINGKQSTLVSASNIKTINGNSLLGSGDLVISGGAAGTDKFGEENTGSAATTITLANTALTNTVRLFKNGVRLAAAQFSVTGATITLTASRVTTDLFQIDYKF